MKISDFTLKFPNIQVIKGEISLFITILIMCIIPIHYQYLPPLMIMLFISCIYDTFKSESNITFNKHAKALAGLFVVFFLWQIITVIYSQNSKLAWSNVFGRLSLLIFPLIFIKPGERIIANKSLLLRIFAISTCLYLLFCFGNAFYRSLLISEGHLIFNPHPADESWSNYFFELEFTNSMHPSYLSMYVLVSVLVSLESFLYIEEKHEIRLSWLIIAVFLLGSLYFISSRAGILAALIVVPSYIIIKIIFVKRFKMLWSAFLLIMFFSIFFIKYNDKVQNLINTIPNKGYALQDERLAIWRTACLKIKDNPLLGVGLGDVRSELIKEYEKRGLTEIAAQGLNAHNQFLETMLEGGIIEIMILMAIFIFMLYASISQKNPLLGLYAIMMIIFFMFETTLYRLAGVAFFSLFSFLLLLRKENVC